VIRAAALIAGPILFAALVFQLQAPGREAGVYVEVSRGGGFGLPYALSGYTVGAVPAISDVATNTLTVNGSLRSFFIVDPEPATLPVSATSTKVYFLVVNNADEAFRAEPLALPVTIRQVNPRVYRITSSEFGPESRGSQYYRQVLSHATGSRATMELLVGLVVQDSSGRRRMYSVRFGPGPRESKVKSPQ
jgi:hypothetical protein